MVGQVTASVQNNARTTTTPTKGTATRMTTVSASNGGRAFNSDGAVVQKHDAGPAAAAAGKSAKIAAIAATNIRRHGNRRVRFCIAYAIATTTTAAIGENTAAAIPAIAAIEGRRNIASNDIAVTAAAAATTITITVTGGAVLAISTVWNGLRAGRSARPCIRTGSSGTGVTCIATIAATVNTLASSRTIKSLCMRGRRQNERQQQRPRERCRA
jgi:hypothetical protein